MPKHNADLSELVVGTMSKEESKILLTLYWDELAGLNDTFEDEAKESCINTLKIDIIKVHDKGFFRIFSKNDDCDGGNTAGVILEQGNKLIARIGDSSVFCVGPE